MFVTGVCAVTDKTREAMANKLALYIVKQKKKKKKKKKKSSVAYF